MSESMVTKALTSETQSQKAFSKHLQNLTFGQKHGRVTVTASHLLLLLLFSYCCCTQMFSFRPNISFTLCCSIIPLVDSWELAFLGTPPCVAFRDLSSECLVWYSPEHDVYCASSRVFLTPPPQMWQQFYSVLALFFPFACCPGVGDKSG